MGISPSDPTLPGFERSLAIVIGINAYAPGVPCLHNAVHDANAVADTLQRQGFEVLRLVDSEASLSALSRLLSEHLPSLQPPPDRMLFYFAGHGLAHMDEQQQLSGFLLPADARRDDLSSYWSMDSLRQGLSLLPCRHLLLILDCCFAGAFPRTSSRDLRLPPPRVPLFLERFRHFTSRRSFQILLSTSHDELASDRLHTRSAQESLGSGLHSPFAFALMEALQPSSPADFNQDGLLTISELYTFLRDRLLTLLPSHSPQTPSLRHQDWHDGGEFLFLLSGSFPALPSAAPLSKQSNPYLGLQPFTSEHRHLFFGRERLVDVLMERLRDHPLLVLSAPSGAGKSSLVHAGLVPRLQEQASWRVPPSLRPSSQPFQQLASWLSSLSSGGTVPSSEALAAEPRLASAFLRNFFSLHPSRSVVLVVDPLEELVTACSDDSLRERFLRALAALLQLSPSHFRLVLLIRADFEPHFLSLLLPSSFPLELWRDGRFLVPPMNREELRLCIQRPAEASVLFFASGLVELLLDNVEQMPGALPLLSVTLSELFEAYIDSGRADRTLAFADEKYLDSGIASALQRRAELVFSGVPPALADGEPSLHALTPEALPAFQRSLRNVLLRMVSPESGKLARRRIARAELAYPSPEENRRVQQALAFLEASRLVVASDDHGPCVEPAHDALLSAWPRLHQWARHAQHELIVLRRISQAASEWLRHGQATPFLWADARLEQVGLSPSFLRKTELSLSLPIPAPVGQSSEPLVFNLPESQFLRASAARQYQLRMRRSALAVSVAISLLALTLAALFNASQAQQQKEAALASAASEQRAKEAALASAKEAQEARDLAEANAQEAQQATEVAEQAKRVAEARAREAQQAQRNAVASAHRALIQQGLAEQNAEEAQRQKEAAELNAEEAERQRALVLRNARLIQARRLLEVDPTKALLVLQEIPSGEGSSAAAWLQLAEDVGFQAISSTILMGPGSGVRQAKFSPDGSRVLTTFRDGTARIWRADGQGAPVVLRGHSRGIITSAFSPDGTRVLTTSEDKTVCLWRADGQGEPQMLKGHSAPVVTVAFSPDGSLIATGSEDGTARLWRTDGKGASRVLYGDPNAQNSGEVSVVRFSPDGSLVLTASWNGDVWLWRTDGLGPPVALPEHSMGTDSATFSPDGTHVVITSLSSTAHIWRTDGQGEPVALEGHADSVTSAAFSPDGFHVLTTSADGFARIFWSSGPSSPPKLFKSHSAWAGSAGFSPDGAYFLTASGDGIARLWRADGSGAPMLLKDQAAPIGAAAFSSDGSSILTTSRDGSVRIWRTTGHGKHLALLGHTASILTTAFSPSGSRAFTASEDGTLRTWGTDGQNGSVALSDRSRSLRSATFSADRSRVLTHSGDDTALLWRTDDREGPLVFTAKSARFTSAAFSPDGSHVLIGAHDGTARIWRTDGQGEPRVFKAHPYRLLSAAFSPDGSRLLTASSDQTARLWRTDGRGVPLSLRGHSDSVATAVFNSDGSRILTAADDGTARLWHTDSQDAPLIFRGHSSWINSAVFSPDDSRVLTASHDGTARLRRSDGQGKAVVLKGHSSTVTSAIFNSDGSRILTASDDGTARLWRGDGLGEPLVLDVQTRVTATAFSPDSAYVAIGCTDGSLHLVPLEPALLRKAFQVATTACLSAQERERYLLESPEEAREGYVRCERSHGRSP